MKFLNKNIIFAAAGISLLSCTPIYKKMNVDKETYAGLNDGLYANLQTTKGNMIVKFEDKKSPVTVANFIGLAEGKIDNKAKAKGVPFYDGTIFHRVIKDFMIQGGDFLNVSYYAYYDIVLLDFLGFIYLCDFVCYEE